MAASSLSSVFSFLVPTKPSPSPLLPQTKTHPFSISLQTSQKPKKASNFALLASTQEHQPTHHHLSTELASVINPSLAFSNTLFFKGYNVQVVVDDNEPEERLLNRFRREVMRAGVIQECKRRRFFENKQDKEKRKTREAAKRNRRRRPQSRAAPPGRPETSTNKKNDDDEDNWDMPEEDVPY